MITPTPLHANSKVVCVIASTRPWTRGMAARLQGRTGVRFIDIDAPSDLTMEQLSMLAPRSLFFPFWSHRIGAEVFQQFECVIFHMTDLPFGRGGSPLQNLIARGIYETQITALRCVKDLDAGPIYLKRPLSLYGSAEEIFIRASAIVEDMIVDIVENTPEPQPQGGEPTVFRRRKPEDGNLASSGSLAEAFDLIRMLDAEGYPQAFVEVGNLRLEFSRASRKTDAVLADVRITCKTKGQSS